jgi:hypothetical protein
MAQATEASPGAAAIMQGAFDSIREVVTADDAAAFHSVSLRDVTRSARALEERMAQQKQLRNMARLQNFFDGVERFEAAEGVGVLSRATQILSWLWVSAQTTHAWQILLTHCQAPLSLILEAS